MKMNTESNRNKIEIVCLRRVSQSQPTAWEGRTANGEVVHISYKYGRLEVLLREQVAGKAGWFHWVTVLSFYPEWMEVVLGIERNIVELRRTHNGAPPATLKEEAWMLFQRKMLGEMRKTNDSEKRADWERPKSRVITVGQLVHWLSLRSENLDALRRDGIAGGEFPVEVTAWADQIE